MNLDTSNKFGVSVVGDQIAVMFHRLLSARAGLLTRDEALVLSAWLAALADPTGERFAQILHEVQNT